MANAAAEDVKMTYWQHLYKDAVHNRSDLMFYDLELRFLRNLLGRYLLWLMEDSGLPKIQPAVEKLQHMENQTKVLQTANESLINRVGLLVENPFAQDESRIREDFRKEMEGIQELVTGFRETKNEIFNLVEQTLRTEKARRMLGMPHETETDKKSKP